MVDEQAWRVVYYIDGRGNSPVEDFLRSLDRKTQARFDFSIRQLQALNTRAGEPLVKHLDGKLWELRRASDGNIYRIVYFFYSGRRIVFLHGFQKKTQKTPRRELEIAQRRMDDFIHRVGEGE